MITPPSSEYQMSSLRTGVGSRPPSGNFRPRVSLQAYLEFYSSASYFRLKRSKSAICEAISSRAASAAERIP